MRAGISITVSPVERRRLQALIRDRNAAQKHVWRAQIVLLTAEGLGTNEIMRRSAKSKTCVWRWQQRFMEGGFESLLRDKTRPSRIPPLGTEVAERVVALTLRDPPAEATHWTAAMMAKENGISIISVQRIWRAHGLQPHRVRQEYKKVVEIRNLSASAKNTGLSAKILESMEAEAKEVVTQSIDKFTKEVENTYLKTEREGGCLLYTSD